MAFVVLVLVFVVCRVAFVKGYGATIDLSSDLLDCDEVKEVLLRRKWWERTVSATGQTCAVGILSPSRDPETRPHPGILPGGFMLEKRLWKESEPSINR